MEKLLPGSQLPVTRDPAPLLAEEKEEDRLTTAPQSGPASAAALQRSSDTPSETLPEAVNQTPDLPVSRAAGERLFVFRDTPESHDNTRSYKRKKKRNFLNLKKCSVAPTHRPEH